MSLLYLNEMYLNTWALAGGAVWERYGAFRRFILAGESTTLELGWTLRAYRLGPFLLLSLLPGGAEM